MAEIRRQVAERVGAAKDEVAIVAFLVGVVAWRVAPMIYRYLGSQ